MACSTMIKWSSALVSMLFLGTIVLLPVAHQTSLVVCCDHEAGCDPEEDGSSPSPAGSDDHDPSTCPLCKVAGTPVVVPVTVVVVDTVHPAFGPMRAYVLERFLTVLLGCQGARAPPR